MTAKSSEGEDAEVQQHQQPKQPHLAVQDASSVDPTKLTALTPEVVSLLEKRTELFCRSIGSKRGRGFDFCACEKRDI